MRRMRGLDATFYEAETPTMHLHVIGAMVLDPSTTEEPWGYDTVLRLLRDRIHLIPPFRWRPISVPGEIDQPGWIEDPDFALERHVRRARLAAPADLTELARFVGQVAGVALDRSRPLWEMHVVEGMAGGAVAIVTKLHHSYMDGGAGGDVMASIFDLTAAGGPVAPPGKPWMPESEPRRFDLLVGSAGGTAMRVARLPGLMIGTARAFPASAMAMLRRTRSGTALGPSTPLNGPLTAERVVAFARCSLDEVRRTKAAFHVTVNDVMLAAATSALRDELLSRDALPDRPLIAMVPISERGTGETEFSNRTTALSVSLPVNVADPVERLRMLHERTVAAKELHAAKGNGMLEGWAATIPPVFVKAGVRALTGTGAIRFLPPTFNVVVSNIPGPPIPLYLAGALVTHLYPMGPLFEGAGLNITLMSHGGVIDVGVMACPAMVDDPSRLGASFVAGLEELGARVGGP